MVERASSLAFRESSVQERERILASGTLEERKEAFKEDEELMRETTKFVSEVIETAATEASKRRTRTEEGQAGEGKGKISRPARAGWIEGREGEVGEEGEEERTRGSSSPSSSPRGGQDSVEDPT